MSEAMSRTMIPTMTCAMTAAVSAATTRAMRETACRPACSATSGDTTRLESVETRGRPQAVSRKPSAVLPMCETTSAAGICGLPRQRRRGLPVVHM
jgi:hypothetical protein